MQEMARGCRFDRIPESRHLAEAANAGADSKSTLAPKFNGHQSEWLIARWYQSEFGAAEDIRR